MLITDKAIIGSRLLSERKRIGLTQAEAADAAGLSVGTYASLERGEANVHLETILSICMAFSITPDDLLTQEDSPLEIRLQLLMNQLQSCADHEKETALRLLEVYLQSLR